MITNQKRSIYASSKGSPDPNHGSVRGEHVTRLSANFSLFSRKEVSATSQCVHFEFEQERLLCFPMMTIEIR